MLETVLYSLRLFVVGGERIAVAMVVVGHNTKYHGRTQHYLLVIGY